MNARTVRRAIERKANKQARKEAKALPTATNESRTPEQRESLTAEQPESPTPATTPLQTSSPNAARSAAPQLIPGKKSTAARDALNTGLTGRTALLSNEEAILYEHHIQSFFTELKPVGNRETELTQSIADSKWRLARIPSLEFGLYALGRIEFAAEFANHPPAVAAALIEAKTFMAYQRQLNNLSIQESRLRRQCEKDTAELTRLQELRAQTDRANAKAATAAAPKPQQQSIPETIGFEFSNPALDPRAIGEDASLERLTHQQAA